MTCACRCHHYGSGSNVTCDVGPEQPGGNRSCTPVHTDPPVATPAEQPPIAPPLERVDPRDLWTAVDKITNPTRHRLHTPEGRLQHVTLPSLWDQLRVAVRSGAGQHTRGHQRSKAPCDVASLSLLVAIARAVREGCRTIGIQRTRDTPRDLRSIVSHVNQSGDQAAMAATLRTLRGWAGQIKATISNDPDRTWRMHGAACTVCASTSVPTWDEEGQLVRRPAMVVHSDDGVIDRVECSFCGSILTGDDLTALVRDTRRKIPAAATTAHAC